MTPRQRAERIQRVGPGTPAGKFLRYFWRPIAGSDELKPGTRRSITLFGENLVLFRGERGPVSERCPHRGVALHRKTIMGQIDAAEAGRDPLGVVRDPAKNEPWIELPSETHFGFSFAGMQSSAAYIHPEGERHNRNEPVPAK